MITVSIQRLKDLHVIHVPLAVHTESKHSPKVLRNPTYFDVSPPVCPMRPSTL